MKPYIKLLSAIAALAVSHSASGEVLVHETFSYPDGLLLGQGGWRNIGGSINPPFISAGVLALNSGDGNRQDIGLPWGASLAAGTRIFAAFDLQVNSFTSPAYDFANLVDNDLVPAANISLTPPVAGGSFRLGINNTGIFEDNIYTDDLFLGTTYKVIMSYDYDSGLSKLWVNPSSENSPNSTTPVAPFVPRFLSQLQLKQERTISTQKIDNVIIGTTFADVLIPPSPSTPVQGPAVERYAARYSTGSIRPQPLNPTPPFDWASDLAAPSSFNLVGNILDASGRFLGWPTTDFDLNNYVGFVVSAAPGVPLDLTRFEFTTAASASRITAYKWGYRINDGAGFGSWTFSETYTPVTPAFSSGLKIWDFTDFSTLGAVEFALFATATSPTGSINPFQTTLALKSTGIEPAPTLTQGTLSKYTKFSNYGISISEASGISYNFNDDTLFCIGDEGTELVKISRTGARLSSMDFQFNVSRANRALEDPEGLAYLGDGKIFISDERRNLAVLTDYVAGAFRVKADLTPTSYFFGIDQTNSGLEGIALDPLNNSLLGVKENSPNRIYEMKNIGLPNQEITDPISLRHLNRVNINQFNDIFVLAQSAAFEVGDPRRENILVLFRSRSLVVEIRRTGEIVGVLDLNHLGRETIEGLTMDDKGNLYLCAEGGFGLPDLLIVVSEAKTPALGTGGRQSITGTVGDDEIVGNQAADVLRGGTGRNTFVYKSLRDGVDTIMDFKPAIDTLDLKVVLTSMSYTGANPLTDGKIRILDSSSGAVVQINSGGSFRTLIVLSGLTAAQANATNNFQF